MNRGGHESHGAIAKEFDQQRLARVNRRFSVRSICTTIPSWTMIETTPNFSPLSASRIDALASSGDGPAGRSPSDAFDSVEAERG